MTIALLIQFIVDDNKYFIDGISVYLPPTLYVGLTTAAILMCKNKCFCYD